MLHVGQRFDTLHRQQGCYLPFTWQATAFSTHMSAASYEQAAGLCIPYWRATSLSPYVHPLPCRSHEVVDISLKQMDSLCGNVLEVEDGKGLPAMAMSTQVGAREAVDVTYACQYF